MTDSTTDLEKGFLSVASHLGKSVYRAEQGDEIEFQLDDGQQRKALIESVEKAVRHDATTHLGLRAGLSTLARAKIAVALLAASIQLA